MEHATRANFLTRGHMTMPLEAARRISHSIKAPHRVTSVQAGATEPVHAETLMDNAGRWWSPPRASRTYSVGHPVPRTLQRQLDHEPDPGLQLLLGYLFNLYRGKPLVREGV